MNSKTAAFLSMLAAAALTACVQSPTSAIDEPDAYIRTDLVTPFGTGGTCSVGLPDGKWDSIPFEPNGSCIGLDATLMAWHQNGDCDQIKEISSVFFTKRVCLVPHGFKIDQF